MGAAAKFTTGLLLMLSLGLHWGLLQTVAWTGMIATYSQESSLSEALSKTFDGENPCALCKVVEEGREAETDSKDHGLISKHKFDAGILWDLPSFDFSRAPVEFPCIAQSARCRSEEPPTPHPKSILQPVRLA